MKKYIELDAVHDAVSKLKRLAWQSSTTNPNAESCVAVELDAVHAAVENIPAADVRPMVRGEWEHTEDFDDYGGGRYVEWTCSVCFCKAKGGWAVRDKHIDEPPAWNFCPNCGADMR